MTPAEPRLAPTSPELVWFTGPDAVRFLNDLISQEIGTAEPGEVRRSLLLSPQGKLDHLLWVLRGDDEVGLVVDAGRGEDLIAKLGRYRIRVEVELERSESPAWLVIGPFGSKPGRWTGDHSDLVADVSWSNVVRTLGVGERPDLPFLDIETYDLLRIEAGEPLMNVDVTYSTIPQETGLVDTSISFNKGCFLGQELVARLDSRGGRVNNHLRILRFDNGSPVAGTEIAKDEKPVGVVTSAAGDAGLALVRRGVEPGDIVDVGTAQAVIEAIPADSPSEES